MGAPTESIFNGGVKDLLGVVSSMSKDASTLLPQQVERILL